jgi:hypothetical protein
MLLPTEKNWLSSAFGARELGARMKTNEKKRNPEKKNANPYKTKLNLSALYVQRVRGMHSCAHMRFKLHSAGALLPTER